MESKSARSYGFVVHDQSVLLNPTTKLDDFHFTDLFWNHSDIESLLMDEENDILCTLSIKPFGLPFGSNLSHAIEKIGTPDLAYHGGDLHGHQHITLLYRRRRKGVILGSQFHFINEKMFMTVEHVLRYKNQIEHVFDLVDPDHKSLCIKLLTMGIPYQRIIDSKANRMVVKSNGTLSILFFSKETYTANNL